MSNTSARPGQLEFGLVGCSSCLERIREEICQCAAYDASVLIMGPTGTGKELIARAIHLQSPRAARPFIPVDCTTITGPLFASQLFGHRKGAFTGAEYETLGCFRAAHGGTIFLDEIGDLEIDLQAKLLRVLQEQTVVPVGSHDGVPIDVRVVAATNRDLKRQVVDHRFREDLFFRLNVITLETVGLDSRREDIPPLCEHFLSELADRSGFPRKHLSPGALELLTAFEWPGNVRQLQHVLEQAAITCESELITLPFVHGLIEKARLPRRRRRSRSAMPAYSAEAPPETVSPREPSSPWKTLDELEDEHLRSTIDRTYYNQTAAANLLGISRYALIRKLKRHGISIRRPNSSPA